ncbi:MAG: nucleoside triphosphate pyrophosphohydrolase [Firmicutes bacterium]|nr:nucleoside triphosphate pyrophosphohydrolase [Bacillota bacterium]
MYEELFKKAETRDEALARLCAIVKVLRSPEGCPWDRAQTHESLIRGMIEEAYEVVEAIENGNAENLREELGDVLLQVVMHAEIAGEEGLFTLREVAEDESEKMLRRHPHVFAEKLENHGENGSMSVDNVLDLWENIKSVEKSSRPVNQAMAEIPRHLPALLRAEKIQKKAAKVGFDWDDVSGAFDKTDEEISELKEAFSGQQGKERLAEELGDLLFAVVNVSRFLDIDPEDALNAASRKFMDRFTYIEEAAAAAGKRLEDMSLAEMDKLWDKAKENTL